MSRVRHDRVRRPTTLLLVAGLLIGWPALAAAPDEQDLQRDRLGELRLFTTAEQRASLEAMRRDTVIDAAGEPITATPAPEQRRQRIPEVRVQGFIQRSGGRSAVWLNDRTALEGERTTGDLGIHGGRIEGGSVVVTLPDGRTVRLKPGQVYDPATGSIVDAYRR